jgi:hypothetical protein
MVTNRLGYNHYIYSGSQRVYTILLRRFSVKTPKIRPKIRPILWPIIIGYLLLYNNGIPIIILYNNAEACIPSCNRPVWRQASEPRFACRIRDEHTGRCWIEFFCNAIPQFWFVKANGKQWSRHSRHFVFQVRARYARYRNAIFVPCFYEAEIRSRGLYYTAAATVRMPSSRMASHLGIDLGWLDSWGNVGCWEFDFRI